MPIAHIPLGWHLRIRILDWSLVSPFWGGFGYLILARGFGKFNSPSIAHRSHVKLPMQGAVGAAKGSPGWDIIALSVQIVWRLSCLLAMNACMSAWIWADTWFKAMAPHSSTLAWKIPWTEEPGRLQSMGSLGVSHDWATSLSLFTFMHWRRKWQPTPVFLPGESQGRGSLVGCRLWGCTESDTTEAT